jgi:bacteriorhodopsin
MNVIFSTNLSILIQIISGSFSTRGIFIKLPEKHKILTQVILLESIVQAIELLFYIFFLRSLAVTNLSQMASIRYFDWVITTPIMLLTTIIFFRYQEYIEKNIDKKLDLWEFIKENKENIITIFTSNFLMLLFGYLGEIKCIDMTHSLFIGFIFFGITFHTIYKNYAIESKVSLKMFYFIFFIWGLYGGVALFDPINKNNMFNILDLFAKNFFGIYLYYLIQKVNNQHLLDTNK